MSKLHSALGFVASFALAAGCATAVGIEDEINQHVNSIRDGGTDGVRTDAAQGARAGTSFTGGSGNLGSGGTSPSSGGAGGSGGFGGTGGSTGKAGSSGSMGSKGGPTDAPCASGLKRCGGICVTPAPAIGCAPSGCNSCPPAPANANAICRSNECAIECNAGYVEKGGRCEATGSGGAGGTSGAGGSGGTGGSGGCTPGKCGACNIAGPFPCCRTNNTCGCSWAPGAYCL